MVSKIFAAFLLCLDFGSLFELEHDLPDELIGSSDLGLTNGGDVNQLHTSLAGSGSGLVLGGQDAASKHKQLSELLRARTPTQHGGPTSNSTAPGASMGVLGDVGVSPGGPQGMHPQGQQQQTGGMQHVGMVGGVLNRAAAMMGAQKGNPGQQQQQGLVGGQMMNGSSRMGYPGSAGMGNNNNVLAETLQQQQSGQQMGSGGQAGMRPQQPGALNKVSSLCASFQSRCECSYAFDHNFTTVLLVGLVVYLSMNIMPHTRYDHAVRI